MTPIDLPLSTRWPESFARRTGAALAIACLQVLSTPAAAQSPSGCGDLQNAFGPWDYRKDRGEPLTLVESAHFTPEVEALIRGKSTANVGQDLDYTLRAFPNHHRALASTTRLADRQKTDKPAGMRYSVDCWFDRAVRWKPDDHVARMLFATWLVKTGRRDAALSQLKAVDSMIGDNPVARYNLGLVYFDLKDYEAARTQAHHAMALGMPRTELRDRLKEVGQWSDPPSSAGASATPASAAASAAAN